MRTYRITSKFRFIFFVALFFVLLTTAANLMLGAGTADSMTVPQCTELEVASGDTLWAIADRYMSGDDIRRSVYELCQLNNISADELQAGMTILVPSSADKQ